MVLRSRRVHRGVPVDGLEPAGELQRGVVGGRHLLELGRVAGREREQLEHVGAEEPLGRQHRQLAGDDRAVVGAVGAVRLVAEAAHQGVPRAGVAGRVPCPVAERLAVADARDRRDHEVEVVGQVRHQVEEVDERAGVGVQQQERRRVLVGGADVDEVDGLAVDLGEELRVGVHPLLLGAPVEVVAPVLHHLAEVGDGSSGRPVVGAGGVGRLGGVARAGEAGVEVVDGVLGDGHREGAQVEGLGLVLVSGHAGTVGKVPAQIAPLLSAVPDVVSGGVR